MILLKMFPFGFSININMTQTRIVLLIESYYVESILYGQKVWLYSILYGQAVLSNFSMWHCTFQTSAVQNTGSHDIDL